MHIVNIHAAKTHLSRLVDAAAAGEEILIARAGKPIARLVPLQDTPVRTTPPSWDLGWQADRATGFRRTAPR